MDAKAISSRLLKALLHANSAASVRMEDQARVHIGNLSIELMADRIIIGPHTTNLTAEQVQLLMDPDSVLWFVARFDDPDFAGRVERFLKRRGVELPANWLGR